MPIKEISIDELRRMNGKEGLILQGCGGDLQEWLDGINDLLTTEGVLLNGSKFDTIYSFQAGDHTDLLFPFDNVELNVGKLAMWRLRTQNTFFGKWLSDLVPNELGGFLTEEQAEERVKPDCELIGQDGNIFNLMGIASRTLKRNGMSDKAKEMTERITNGSVNYYEALGIIGEYVNWTIVNKVDKRRSKIHRKF
ncbi:MAG: hypothetical protein LUG21_03280, partial [Clostridiales bacterium]|nr:hypothetical protein [Clostridiales bacterium]